MLSKYVTQIKNWFLNDPLVDYLNVFGDKTFMVKPHYEECDFTKFIMDMGNKYEEVVVTKIKKMCDEQKLTYKDIDRKAGYHQTKEAFLQKTDVIFQAQVKDWDQNIVGYPDILIKVSAFKKIFGDAKVKHLPDKNYVVFDVKYSSFNQKENNIEDDNDYTHFVRGQIACYTLILNKMLKQKVDIAFIISKDLTTLTNPLYTNVNDQLLINDIDDAFDWINQLYTFGKGWVLNPPTNKYLLPNMSNTKDGYWRNFKELLAKEINEVSLIPGIGNKVRAKLHSSGIYDYNLISSDTISNQSFLYINSVTSNTNCIEQLDLTNIKSSLDSVKFVYIDIETCYKFELTESGQEYITMIGIYYNSIIKKFTLSNTVLTKDNETELINMVDQFLKELNEQKEIVIVHYTEAEQKVFKRFSEKYTTLDLHAYLQKNFTNDCIRDLKCFSLQLKHIISRLYEMNIILDDPYQYCNIKNGLEVTSAFNQLPIKDELLNEIEIYNIADCKCLHILHMYLVKNNILI